MSDKVKNTVSVVGNIGPIREPSAVDVAWMAGFYEGEGTCKGDIKGRTVVRICQKDPETLLWCREMIGGAIFKTRANSEKYLHVLTLCGDNGRRFLQSIFPFMSTRRKMQIEKAGGLKLTGKPQGLSNRVMSTERKAKRAGMTKKQRDVESVLYGRSLNLEKCRARDREYAAKRRSRTSQISQQSQPTLVTQVIQ